MHSGITRSAVSRLLAIALAVVLPLMADRAVGRSSPVLMCPRESFIQVIDLALGEPQPGGARSPLEALRVFIGLVGASTPPGQVQVERLGSHAATVMLGDPPLVSAEVVVHGDSWVVVAYRACVPDVVGAPPDTLDVPAVDTATPGGT